MNKQEFKAYTEAAKRLNPVQLQELMYAIHAAVLEDDLMVWLPLSFEDMGDSVAKAIDCLCGEPA
jgi:hypothetical protein